MDGEIYNYKKSISQRVFYFKSSGPKGVIPKAVLFKEIGLFQYNMALISKAGGKWQDKNLANNNDMYKTFRTIFQIFIEFTSLFVAVRIYFEENSIDRNGRDVSKNIAYERFISGLLTTLLSSGFKVDGFIDDGWKNFEKGKNYEAFLITKV